MESQKSPLVRFGSWLRSNWLAVGIFFSIGVAVLYGQQALLTLTSYLNGVDSTTVAAKLPANMSSAEVAAARQAGGWVPAGYGSKFLFAAGFFFLFIALIWAAQSIAAKYAKSWTKTRYKQEFDELSTAEKFREYHTGRWQLVALACASIIAAALIV